MRKLIIRVFYISVKGLSRQQAEQTIFQLMQEYKPNENLPDDILEHYFIHDIWLPITEGQSGESRVEIIYPNKFEVEDLDLESIDKLIERLKEIKEEISIPKNKNF
jgi:hypothetical protein